MAGIVNGQLVDQTNSNAAWLAKNGDDATIGKVGLNNSDVVSGAPIVNTQREINSIESFVGAPAGAVYNVKPTWTSSVVGTSTDSVKTRADLLTALFDVLTGHRHDGVDSRVIPYSNLSGIQLKAGYADSVTLVVTGTTYDASTMFNGLAVSTGPTQEGIVTNAPYNYSPVTDVSGVLFVDANNRRVYSRVTNSGGPSGTWTISFYTRSTLGVETPYSFAASTSIKFYNYRLYREETRPVYDNAFVRETDISSGNSIQLASGIPTGTVDDSNQTFTLSSTPRSNAELVLMLDGVPQVYSREYTRTGVTITMTTAPNKGQELFAIWVVQL